MAGSKMEPLQGDLPDEVKTALVESVDAQGASDIYSLLSEAKVGIAVCDPRGRILRVNGHYCEVVGLAPSALVGSAVHDLLPPDERARVQRPFRRLTQGGPSFRVETRLTRPDGVRVWASQQFLAQTDADEKVVAVVIVLLDDTARKVARKQVRELNEQLEEQMRHKTAELEATIREMESFNYSITHDLRTPLRAIRGYTGLLLETHGERMETEARKQLENVYEATQRMADTIDGLLRLSRMSRVELRRQPVNLSELVRNHVAELRKRHPGRKVKLIVAKELVAQADPQMAEILLQNLLDNAWKFTRKSEKAQIEFGQEEFEGRTHYFVRDNGAGFDMADADKLFQPFRRLHRASDYEGTGIGLATVYRIIRRHGGRIQAKAAVNEGATFYFTLSRWEQWG